MDKSFPLVVETAIGVPCDGDGVVRGVPMQQKRFDNGVPYDSEVETPLAASHHEQPALSSTLDMSTSDQPDIVSSEIESTAWPKRSLH